MDTGTNNLAWARALVDALIVGTVRHACVSPGSRSSPLAVAVAEAAARKPGFTSSVHLDERSAGYFAVGYGRATGRPAMLVCTSGTAAANYLPAVVEAAHSRVPMVVVTADRPPELRDSGAWQTIDQVKLFGDHARWFVDVAVPSDVPHMLAYVRDVGARAASVASGRPSGPVHLNVPFGEPLLPDAYAMHGVREHEASAAQEHGMPAFGLPQAVLQDDDLDALARGIAGTPRGLILAGQLDAPAGYADAMARLAEATGYPVLAEPTGGLRCGPHDRSHVVTCYEAVLRSNDWCSRHVPDLVMRFGQSFVWRQVTEFIANHAGARRIFVDPQATWDDPTRLPSTRLAVDPVPLCLALADRLEGVRERNGAGAAGGAWLSAWREADETAASVLHGPLAAENQGDGSTAWVVRSMLDVVPDGGLIYAANSMAVRDLDSFGPTSGKRVRVIANRGAAGIDGTVSSSIGAAFGSGLPTVLLTGDLAFAHDVNGLPAAGLPGLDLTIVVLNDGGGGIFEYLPAAALEGDLFERYFSVPSGLDIAAACAAYGVAHHEVHDAKSLGAVVRAGPGVRVAEVPIDRRMNTAWHRRYWSNVTEGLGERARV